MVSLTDPNGAPYKADQPIAGVLNPLSMADASTGSSRRQLILLEFSSLETFVYQARRGEALVSMANAGPGRDRRRSSSALMRQALYPATAK